MNGLLPIFSKFESQYNKLYCDIGLNRQALGDRPERAAGVQGALKGAQGQPRYGRLCQDTGHDTAKGGHDTVGSARGLADGLYRDTQFCIVTEARDLPLRVMSRYSLCIVQAGSLSSESVTIQSLVS